MAKPRGDSKLASLPEHIREELDRWLTVDNVTYAQAKERLHLDFNFETSERALSAYYTTELFEVRNRRSADLADRVAVALAANPDKFDQATIGAIRQRTFEAAIATDGNVQELSVLAKILGDSAKLRLKSREIEQADRRLAMLEEKHAQVKAQLEAALGKARSKGGFTPELLKNIEEAVGMLG